MKQVFGLLMGIQFFIYFGFSVVIPVIPALIAHMNLSAFHMGLLLASYSIASFIAAPFWGQFSDNNGRKKVLLIGLIGFTVSFLTFGLFIGNLPMLYVSRIIGGLFSGACFSTTTSIVADLTTAEERNRYMGLLGMMIGLGFIFGPAVGGLLAGISYQLPYFITAVILMLIFILVLIKLPETHHERSGPEDKRINWQIFRQPVGLLLLCTFIVMMTMSGMESSFQLLEINRINITPTEMGLLFMVGGFVSAILQGGYLRKVKHGAERQVMIAGQIITAVAFIMLPFTMNLAYAGLCLVLLMAGNAMVRTLLTSTITKTTTAQHMGKLTGISYSLDSLGRIIGPLAFTGLLTFDLSLPFYIGAVTSMLSLILIYIYFSKGQLA
ncbi:MFS transporter [Macrococcus equipercicus]|uniref:MFS transporter n=1 Tax=Macrococcus equipercicus TaxID=69967 RepID=A0A9Q9F2I3_9STAP|nr:TCR/Tet family MFS transporter [Macrococcus equipercicus]UTH14815.1 MFS transporter [Macrococcus equipercicus]